MLHWAISLILFSITTWPAEVVFIEAHDQGRLIQLEPNGRFYHVAIRYQNQWLHAHPHRGVDLVEDITPYGDKFLVLHNSAVPDPSPEFVAAWLGKPFDRGYHWNNPIATYCTRLIAEILGVAPRPMWFEAPHWARHQGSRRGEPGLSPDELFKELIGRNFFPSADCSGDLEPD